MASQKRSILNKFNLFFFLVSVLFVLLASHSRSEEKKQFDEEEFTAKVFEEVEKRIKKIKNSSIVDISEELLQRERKLDARERKINLREEQVIVSEQRLNDKIEEFYTTQTKILGCIQDNKDKRNLRVSQLVNVISNMKPVKAAEVLSVQDDDISVQILSKLEAERASKIFNVMDKEISARLQKAYLNMTK